MKLRAFALIGIVGCGGGKARPDAVPADAAADTPVDARMPARAQQAYIKSSHTAAGTAVGMNVALSGDGNTLVVGRWDAIEVFVRSGTAWAEQATLVGPTLGDGFGGGSSIAVSADGNTIATGAQRDSSSAMNNGAVHVFTRAGTTWTEQAYLKASNADAYDYFGWSVALSASGDTLAVGAYGEASAAPGINGDQSDNTKVDAGAVYVFTRAASTWSQQAYVKASNPDAYDEFGLSVAVSGDGNTLLVGAPGEASAATGVDGDQTDNSVRSGAAYTFTRAGSTWSQDHYIKASTVELGDGFANTVAMSGDGNTFVAGAPGEDSAAVGVGGNQADNSAADSGAAYVFVRGSTWAQQAYVKASNTDAGDGFAASVAISADGGTLVAGAWHEDSAARGVDGDQADNSAADAGAAYAYVRTGSSWVQQAYLKESNTDAGDSFGFNIWSVAVSGDATTIAVGAPNEKSAATTIDGDQSDNSATGAGAVYVFR